MSPDPNACAHLRVEYQTSTDRTTFEITGWWECVACCKHFIPQMYSSSPHPDSQLSSLVARLDKLQGKLDRHEDLFNRVARAWNGREPS